MAVRASYNAPIRDLLGDNANEILGILARQRRRKRLVEAVSRYGTNEITRLALSCAGLVSV